MEDLSLHVLDVVENSIAASARNLRIRVVEYTEFDLRLLEITDDGHGMAWETVRRAPDPFFTTDESKRIGLGIPLLAQAVQECDGSLDLLSEVGTGTVIRARFRLSHPDLKPLGDMAATIKTLLAGRPELHIEYEYLRDGQLVAGIEAGAVTGEPTW